MPEAPAVSHVRFNWTVASILGGLAVQSAGLVVWGAKLEQRVEALEQKVEAAADVGETVARIDERSVAMRTTIDRIERQLDGERERGRR